MDLRQLSLLQTEVSSPVIKRRRRRKGKERKGKERKGREISVIEYHQITR
jgi:hypothetical protein